MGIFPVDIEWRSIPSLRRVVYRLVDKTMINDRIMGAPFFSLSLYMGMGQNLLVSILMGWTSIYQLFWCSPGVQGFDTLPHNMALFFVGSQFMNWSYTKSVFHVGGIHEVDQLIYCNQSTHSLWMEITN